MVRHVADTVSALYYLEVENKIVKIRILLTWFSKSLESARLVMFFFFV